MSDITHQPPGAGRAAAGHPGRDRSDRGQAAPRDPALPENQVDVAMHRVKVRVVEDALDANNTIARANREDFDRAGVTVVNLMSAPGAGKTALLERALADTGDVARRRARGRRRGLARRRAARLAARPGRAAEHGRRLRRRVPPRRQHGSLGARLAPARGDRPADHRERRQPRLSRPSSGWARTCGRWSARSPRARTSH